MEALLLCKACASEGHMSVLDAMNSSLSTFRNKVGEDVRVLICPHVRNMVDRSGAVFHISGWY